MNMGYMSVSLFQTTVYIRLQCLSPSNARWFKKVDLCLRCASGRKHDFHSRSPNKTTNDQKDFKNVCHISVFICFFSNRKRNLSV